MSVTHTRRRRPGSRPAPWRRHTRRPPPPRPHSQGRSSRCIRTGVLVPYVRGVYRLAGAPVTAEQAMALACAVAPDVVVSLRLGRSSVGHAPGRQRRFAPCHHRRPGPPVDPGRSRASLAPHRPRRRRGPEGRHPRDEPAAHCLRPLGQARPTSDSTRSSSSSCTAMPAPWPTLLETGSRLGERGRPGSARFARVLSRAVPTGSSRSAPTSSSASSERSLAAGLPRPERQAAVTAARRSARAP